MPPEPDSQKATAEGTRKPQVPRILVYGIDRLGIEPPKVPIGSREFSLEVCKFDAPNRFDNYDGVILFQSTFETVERIDSYTGSHRKLTYNRDELVRRRNQTSQLLEKDGFICFLLWRDFVEHDSYGHEARDTDLAKFYSNFSGLFRERLGEDRSITKIYRSEFEPFLKDYGVARTEFSYYSRWLEANIRKICDAGSHHVAGFILENRIYFVPCQLPSGHEASDFFRKLASALVATAKKLVQELPAWVDEYRLPNEAKLLEAEAKAQQEVEEIRARKTNYKTYKQCLCYDGELLVESVSEVLREGLGFKVDERKDEGIEDRAIVDDQGNELVLIEIKGSNANVDNNAVYQADSHRGRREKPDDFPSVLIVNTFIQSSNTIEQKARDINTEQVKLAVKKQVLMLRTIDLLNLLYLKEQGKIDTEQLGAVLTTQKGWLKVSQENYEVSTA